MILRERVVEEFCELVTIDAPSYKERQMVDLLKGKLEALGFEVIEDQVGKLIGGNCGNLLAFLPANDPELAKLEPILFSAHMDTVVPAIGKKAIVHEDGRITSDGMTVLGADDVSGIVSILEGIRSIKESGRSHRGIEVLFTVAEEVFTKGCSNFDCTKLRSKEAYILDLSGRIGTAAYTAPSIISFEIKVHGHAAHAGFEPEKGDRKSVV